ncbi:MAG: hypothetical protein WA532_00385 [Candidatus Korobacteraceae bacterium]
MNDRSLQAAAEGKCRKARAEEDENPANFHEKVSGEIIGNLGKSSNEADGKADVFWGGTLDKAGPSQVKTRHDVERDPHDGHGHVHVHDVHACCRGRARRFAKLSPELRFGKRIRNHKLSEIKSFQTTHGNQPGFFVVNDI